MFYVIMGPATLGPFDLETDAELAATAKAVGEARPKVVLVRSEFAETKTVAKTTLDTSIIKGPTAVEPSVG